MFFVTMGSSLLSGSLKARDKVVATLESFTSKLVDTLEKYMDERDQNLNTPVWPPSAPIGGIEFSQDEISRLMAGETVEKQGASNNNGTVTDLHTAGYANFPLVGADMSNASVSYKLRESLTGMENQLADQTLVINKLQDEITSRKRIIKNEEMMISQIKGILRNRTEAADKLRREIDAIEYRIAEEDSYESA